MFRKISWELTFSYILVIVLLMAVLGFFLLNFIENFAINTVKQELYEQAQLIAEGWPQGTGLKEPSVREMRFFWNTLERISRQTGSRVRILTDRGVPIYDTGGEKDLDLTLRAEVQSALQGKPDEDETRTSFTQTYPILQYEPMVRESRIVGVVYITRSRSYIQTIISLVKTQFYVVFFISLIVAIALALFLSHYITRPIVNITAQADRMARGELNQRVQVNTRNEIGALSAKFNIMAEKLQGTLNQLRGEKNKLATVINTMAGGVLVIDQQLQIIMINKTAFQLLGIRQKNIVDKKISTVLPGHSLLRLLEDSQLKIETRGALEDLPDNRAVDAQITPLLNEEGTTLGAVIILNDVTEFRQLDRMRAEFVS
ncbi:MAG: HAMP domain-containing protein, partial [Vulcanimicrobiota bacterium]